MKRLLSAAAALAMVFGCANFSASAADELSASVYVTISNKGELVAVQQNVAVSDADNDGSLTVSDALFALHEAVYEGGAEAGYSSYTGDYGLSLGKLWGDDSGNFGYCKNNSSCFSLADTVADGDYITAYIYSDTDYYSDMYTFFDVNTASANAGEEIILTLSGSGYDADWNPVTLPVEGAVITLDGEETEYVTDAEGKVSVTIESEGKYTISAKSNTQIIVPPVCIAEISAVVVDEENSVPSESESVESSESSESSESISESEGSAADVSSPDTGDDSNVTIYAAIFFLSVMMAAAIAVSSKKSYEK